MAALQGVLGDENAPGAAERTHAAADFEKQLHDEAWKGEEEDMAGDAQKGSRLEQIKAQVVHALTALKLQAPLMEQVKQVAPQAYQAMVGLTQAVVGMARELAPAPMQKSETLAKKDKAEKYVGDIRNVLSEDLLKPQYKGSDHCMKGHCYVASEALYHLLGGKEAGWTPHHVQHEGGPHWFLKHAGGRIIDPTSDQFKTPVPYHKGQGGGFLTDFPSERTRGVLERMLGEGTIKQTDAATLTPHHSRAQAPKETLDKGGLPMPGAPAHSHLNLPSGSTLNGKVKVTHEDGKQSWKQVAAGQIRSQDPAGHPTSSRSPSSK